MSDTQTSHYDTFQNTGRSVMVLDSIRAVCEAINNDALASTKEQPVIAGIENPCSTLGQGSQLYTTVPLRPLTGDCNFLLNNYIHHRIPFNIKLTSKQVTEWSDTGVPTYSETAADGNPTSDIDFAIYFLSSSLMPKRFQLMIGNTVIYQNTFQRTEATVTINSLPPDVVEKSDDITTMSKLMQRKTIPGIYLTWPAGQNTMTFNFEIDTAIDLQRFAPIISNLAFIPVEYGDLKLRLFYDDLLNALDISVLPSERNANGVTWSTGTITAAGISHNGLNVVERKPLMSPDGIDFIEPQIASMTPTGDSAATISLSGGKNLHWEVDRTACSWGYPLAGQQVLVEIIQSTFRLREESKILLKNYIMQDNRLIIPTHTWSTALALSKLDANQGAGQVLWNFSAYNIDMLAVTFPMSQSFESYLPTPQFTSFDLKLNSKSVNYIPYEGTGDARMIKDTKQAFLNTDEYATNENLTYSLKRFNSQVGANLADGRLTTSLYHPYVNSSNTIDYKPNTFCYAINLTPPNSFEKGMCVASSNPQAAQLRLNYQLLDQASYTPATSTLNSLSMNHMWNKFYDSTKRESNPMALALQACCLVLIYNPIVGACQAGEVVFVEPFLN